MSFDSLGLSTELLRAVSEQGYSDPTPVQKQAIPIILAGRDIMAGAQTGTGKTAGFTLPLLQRLDSTKSQDKKRFVRALILTPTRELAAQVSERRKDLRKNTCPCVRLRYNGGVNINPQIDALRKGVDILVATPGRLLDHVGQKTVDLSRVDILVLDEADRMLDMGFIKDIRKILALIPNDSQNLLFSATFSSEINHLAGGLLNNPEKIQVTPKNETTELITQIVHPVDRSSKRQLLVHLVKSQDWQQVLLFMNMKHTANRLAQQLNKAGITAMAIHGDKTQSQRTKALADFKKGKVRILVATDVAARGLDIDQLPHVINYELPTEAEIYVHRIGRTGRAGNEGEAVSFVAGDEIGLLQDIEKLIGMEIPQQVVPGYEPDPRIQVQPDARRAQAHRNLKTSSNKFSASRLGSNLR